MEAFYFTLGILTVLIIMGAVGIVSIWNKVSNIENTREDLEDYICDTADDFNTELDKVTNYIENQLSGLEKDVNAESEELGNVIDSKDASP